MLRHVAVVVAILAVIGGSRPLPAAPVPTHLMPKESPFSFPTTVGTTWVYDTGNGGTVTLIISKVEKSAEGKLVTTEYVEADGKRRHHMTRLVSEKGLFLVSEGGNAYKAPWCVHQLPHKEGQKWNTDHGPRTAGPVEKVKVPAGEITAARVEWDTGGGRLATYWYAHGIGLVRQDGGTKWNLKSFAPGKE